MRVLNVIGEMGYGGAELLTLEIGSRLTRESVDVSIAVLGFCDEEVARRAEFSGVRLIRYGARPNSPLNVWRVLRSIRSDDYDVVHAHLFPSLYWVAIARLLVRRKTCWIYTEHSTNNSRRQHAWLGAVEGFIYRRYDRIVCIAQDVRTALAAWIPGLVGTTVITNGVDVDRFRNAEPIAREGVGLNRDDCIIFMAGAFRSEKNHAGLLRAMALLPHVYKLVLAGEGAERRPSEALAAELGILDRVHFLGAISNVDTWMKTADVYVLPSLFEGFGLSAVEAAATGLPIVYADVAGLGAVFAGVGIPVIPTDPASIARGVLDATRDATVREDLSRRSRRLAGRHGIQQTASRYKEAYMECIAGGSR